MFKDKKTRIYWCKSCKVPVISDSSNKSVSCKLCGNTAEYMCSDVRPVFPEERLFIEILLANPFDCEKCSVWASKSGRYYIDGKSCLVPKNLYSFENAAKVREQIDKYKNAISYERFNLFISRFIEANKNRLDSLKYEAYNFIESAAQYIQNKNMFISFSGGKDSTVCADLVVRALANPKIVHMFGDTTLEFDITYDYVDRFIKNHPQTIFKIVKNTEQDFFEVCKDIGPPAKKMRWCCTMFKSSPISRVIHALYGDKTVLSFNGIRACESSMRSKYERLTIDPKHRKIQQQITASPIFHWCDADVWNYISSENIDFNFAYRFGYNRIGCWPCPNHSPRITFLTQIYFPKEATAWRNQLIAFAKSIGKPDAEVYVDEANWTARQGGNGLDTASDAEITADVCTNDENAQVYLLKKPVCDEFINLFIPFGRVSKELGRKLINEVLILDIKSNVPILSIQDFNDGTGQYKVKIKTMNVKNHTDLRRKVGYQIIKYNACRSCRKCESVCSFGAISINDGHYKIDSKKCRHCQKCVTYKYIAGGCMMKKVLYVSKKGCKIMQIDIETLQAFKEEKTINFISNLEDLFNEYLDSENTDSNLTAMQAWLYSLPRHTSVSNKVYAGNRIYRDLTASTILFRNSLKNPEIKLHTYILKKLPEIFLTDDYDKIFKCIVDSKKELENEIKSTLSSDICNLWETSDNDLFLVMRNWYDSLPEKTKKHLFDNGEDNLFKIINEHKDDSFLEELSLLICGIKIEDFKENSPEIFTNQLKTIKETIEQYPYPAKHSDKFYEILYSENANKTLYATFKQADYDENTKMMYSEFKHYLSEYGNSLTANQKRQVLVDLLVNIRR